MKNREGGNAIVYILIAVALLAALIFAVSQNSRDSATAVTDEKAKLYASDIIQYGNTLGQAVTQLKLRGCDISEISFENDLVAGYANGTAPADDTCDVFELKGGGITPQLPPTEILDGASMLKVTTDFEVSEVGTTCGDDDCVELVYAIGPLKVEVCTKINTMLGVNNPGNAPPLEQVDFASAAKYDGTIGREAAISSPGNDVSGKTAGCLQDDEDLKYYFFKVLWAR